MRIRWNFRMRPGFGPFHANITKHRWRSTSITLVKKLLTWNPKRHTISIDTPGPGSFGFTYGKPEPRQRNRTRRKRL